MATVATRQEKNFAQRKNEITHLTPTGLLMEGLYTQNPDRQSMRGVLGAAVLAPKMDGPDDEIPEDKNVND
jgi:hypothetical protein